MTSFTSSKGQVLLSGIELSDHRVEDLLTFFQRQEAEAEKAASEARAAFNALWDRRCEAMDYRHDRVSRSLTGYGDFSLRSDASASVEPSAAVLS